MDLIPMDPNTATAVIGSNTVKLQNPDLSLNRKAKAAIVVRLLLKNGADIPHEELPEDSQATLPNKWEICELWIAIPWPLSSQNLPMSWNVSALASRTKLWGDNHS